MTPKKVKQLLKLLDEFQHITEKEHTKDGVTNSVAMSFRERTIIQAIQQWVKWYGRDELDMDL
jgi:hypothetical protein